MSNLPEPPLPANTDLQKLDGFMLNTERLLGSELVALSTGDEFKAATLLWCRSWKQVPACSLPNNDKVLASFAGLTLSKWKKVREMALRGFVECSDGRLYHMTLVKWALKILEIRRRFTNRIDRRLEILSEEWAQLRLATFKRDDFTCQYCGKKDVRLECDHVIPVAAGGASAIENLTTACKTCNRSKGAKLLSEWRA